MAGTNETITLTILAKDLASGNIGGLVGKLDALAKRGGLAGSIAQGVGLSIGTMINPIALVTKGIGALTDFMGDSIAKAAEEQVGIVKLGVALKDNVAAWDGNTDAIERVIKSREALSFSDGEQRDVLGQLVTRTHNVTAALDLERQAMDLARAKGIALTDAATIIGKVYGGNVAILKRYGIAVTDGATAEEALAQIQKATAGQAEAYSKTLEGSQAKLAIAFDDLQESIGAVVIGPLTDFVSGLADLVSGGPPAEGVLGTLTAATWKQVDATKALVEATGGDDGSGGDKTWIGLIAFQEHMDDFYAFLGDPRLQEGDRLFREFGETVGGTGKQFQDFAHAQDDLGLSYEEMRQKLMDAAEDQRMLTKGTTLMGGAFETTAAVITDTAGQLPGTINDMAIAMKNAQKGIFAPLFQGAKQAIEVMTELPGGIAAGIRSERGQVKDAMAQLRFDIEHPMKEAKYEDWLQAKLTSKAVREGLKSHNPQIRAETQQLVDWIKAKLAELNGVDVSIHTTVTGAGPRHHSTGGYVDHDIRGPGRASGGSVMAGGTYTVGERGPETLVMGGQSGTIVPGAGGLHVHLHGIFAGTEDGLRRLGEILMPAITRAQRRAQVG